MAEKLTAVEARTVKLPPVWHPLRRVALLEEYGEALGIHRVGILPAILTRGELVYHASHEDDLTAVHTAINARREAGLASDNIEGEE